jgi:hypothetical protein
MKNEYKMKVIAIGPVVTTAVDLAAAFNEWMRLTIEEPETFLQEWQAIVEFQGAEAHGDVPEYGRDCVTFLLGLLKAQQAKSAAKRVSKRPPSPKRRKR